MSEPDWVGRAEDRPEYPDYSELSDYYHDQRIERDLEQE